MYNISYIRTHLTFKTIHEQHDKFFFNFFTSLLLFFLVQWANNEMFMSHFYVMICFFSQFSMCMMTTKKDRIFAFSIFSYQKPLYLTVKILFYLNDDDIDEK